MEPMKVRAVDSDTTLDPTDEYVLVNTENGAVTVTFPDAVTAAWSEFTIVNLGGVTPHNVTLHPAVTGQFGTDSDITIGSDGYGMTFLAVASEDGTGHYLPVSVTIPAGRFAKIAALM